MATTITRSLSRRNRFFSAGGNRRPLCCRAAYGGGRDVFRGGIAKCIVVVRVGAARERPLLDIGGGGNEGWQLEHN